MSDKKSASSFLTLVIGRPVLVKLNDGTTLQGILACLDGYMNLAMEQVQEFGRDAQLAAKYPDAFIRGNNVLYITPQGA